MCSIPPAPPQTAAPLATASPATVSNGSQIDARNVLTKYVGDSHNLILDEGTYTFLDSLALAAPPALPFDPPASDSLALTNPLLIRKKPYDAAFKLSLCVLEADAKRLDFNVGHHIPNRAASLGEQDSGEKSSTSSSFDMMNQDDLGEAKLSRALKSTGREAHKAAWNAQSVSKSVVKDNSKRRKPKSSLVKSNSHFISRVMPHDQINKRLADHSPTGIHAFANFNRALQWLDLSAPASIKPQPMLRILLARAHILCHDVNQVTKAQKVIDVVVGTDSADIIWFEAVSQKYSRINKSGVINASPVTNITWLPGSEDLFLACHEDGKFIIYDRGRDDAEFISDINASPRKNREGFGREIPNTSPPKQNIRLHVYRSFRSADQKTNPVAVWQISQHPITAVAFSPDCRHLAVVAEDGSLTIVDYLNERILHIFSGYYGAFTCVCWAPDGNFLVTGGQDDLVSIWHMRERRLVARCHGHQSWVTMAAFDPWHCKDGFYRFGSVGEDCRMLFWDFDIRILLQRKKNARTAQKSFAGIKAENTLKPTRMSGTSYSAPSDVPHATDNHTAVEHVEHEATGARQKADNHNAVAHLMPSMNKVVDEHRVSWLGYEMNCIITACVEGHIRTWMRP